MNWTNEEEEVLHNLVHETLKIVAEMDEDWQSDHEEFMEALLASKAITCGE